MEFRPKGGRIVITLFGLQKTKNRIHMLNSPLRFSSSLRSNNQLFDLAKCLFQFSFGIHDLRVT